MSFPPPPRGASGLPPPPLAKPKPTPKPAGGAAMAMPPPPLAAAATSALPPPPAAIASPAAIPPALAAAAVPPPLSPLPKPVASAFPPPPLAALPQGIPPPLAGGAPAGVPPPISAVPAPLAAVPPPVAGKPGAAKLPPPPAAVAKPNASPFPRPAAVPKPAAVPRPAAIPKPAAAGAQLPPPPAAVTRRPSTPAQAMPPPSFGGGPGGEASPEEQREAAHVIQTYYRLYAAKKGYKKLYKERGWTLCASSDRVLTSHVTKSRPTTPNRRRPTRGRRVRSQAQTVPDPERGPSGAGGAGVVVSETAKRALAQSTGQILFDPSKVTLRKTPGKSLEAPEAARPMTGEIPRRARGMTAGGVGRLQGKPARPMSMVLPGAISKAAPASASAGSAFPPPPAFGEKGGGEGGAFPPPPVGETPSTPPPAAATPSATPSEKKRRMTVGKRINTFLQKRPARDELVNKGVLQPDEFQELAKQDMVTQKKDGSDLRPMAMKSSTCMNIRCEKKLKKNAKHNCKKCGRAFCKSCMNKKAKIPELKYNKPVPMCDTCFLKQKAQAQAEADAAGP
mmetsp:Transcript_2231/g.7952  ORF Transcript_2231/g.7952 Transcript_2231/m.7952 type:complete len:564 (+) Transcript_2231:71-1762(+)